MIANTHLGDGKPLNPSGTLWPCSINLMARDYIGHYQSASQRGSQPEMHYYYLELNFKITFFQSRDGDGEYNQRVGCRFMSGNGNPVCGTCDTTHCSWVK